MKERPILFSAPMVRALLAGTKTQTRRVVKPHIVASMDPPRGQDDVKAGYPFVETNDGEYVSAYKLCPYGQPGDRLWVRESWYQAGRWDRVSQPEQPWEGDQEWRGTEQVAFSADTTCPSGWRSRPSIHLPRKFSRITLEVTDIRVQRLNSIPLADIRAEGVEFGDADKG